MNNEEPTAADIVRHTLEDLHKLMSAVRLYGNEHPKTSQVASNFAGRLNPMLAQFGELDLGVQRDGLYWSGEAVYGDDDEREGIARVLHREGIIRFTLHPGLVRDEILLFAKVLGTNLNLPRWEEETLTSLLWQASLEHVTYDAVEYLSDAQEMSETAAVGEENYVQEIMRMLLDPEPPDFGQGAGGFGAAQTPDAGGPDGGPGRDGRGDGPGDQDDKTSLDPEAGGKAGERDEADEARTQMAVPDPSWTPAQHIAALDLSQWADMADGELEKDIDIDAYRRDVAMDNEHTLLRRVVEVLVVGGAQGRPELLPEMAMSAVERALFHEEADGPTLWKPTIYLVQRVLTSDIPLLESGREPLEDWLDGCTSTDLFPALAHQFDPQSPDDLQLMRHFLSGRKRARARLLAERLRGLEGRRYGWVMDEVARLVGTDFMRMTADIHRRPVEEVVPLLDILHRIGGEDAGRQVAELLQHKSPDIRAAAIRALPRPVPPTVVPRVLELLTDRDRNVRLAVIEMLRAQAMSAAFPALKVLVTGKRFEAAAASIKRSLAIGLAVSGRDASIPVLQEIMGRHRGLFAGPSAKADFEACAAGLAYIETVRSRQVLVQGAKSLNPYMRRACKEALEGGGRGR